MTTCSVLNLSAQSVYVYRLPHSKTLHRANTCIIVIPSCWFVLLHPAQNDIIHWIYGWSEIYEQINHFLYLHLHHPLQRQSCPNLSSSKKLEQILPGFTHSPLHAVSSDRYPRISLLNLLLISPRPSPPLPIFEQCWGYTPRYSKTQVASLPV